DQRHPVQVVHSPVPARIGGQGSASGSVGGFILDTESLASLAAAATSSGNSFNALSSPAPLASSSIVALSMIPEFPWVDPDAWLRSISRAAAPQAPMLT